MREQILLLVPCRLMPSPIMPVGLAKKLTAISHWVRWIYDSPSFLCQLSDCALAPTHTLNIFLFNQPNENMLWNLCWFRRPCMPVRGTISFLRSQFLVYKRVNTFIFAYLNSNAWNLAWNLNTGDSWDTKGQCSQCGWTKMVLQYVRNEVP